MRRTHFLHIRKTGGSAIKHALGPWLAAVRGVEIILHSHDTTLAQVPVGEKVIFGLRDPVDRFVSGFNSRKRRGRPRYNSEWSAEEAAAFDKFATPNDLATALSPPAGSPRQSAVAAMQAIRHVNSFYADWLNNLDYVQTRRRDILWVGLTGRLPEDFDELKRLLDLPPACQLPDDPVTAHQRFASDPIDLSPPGLRNIREWYADDYLFLQYFFGTNWSAS